MGGFFSAPTLAAGRRNRVHTVLIVDDEPRILDSVRMNLELEGYQVFEATNGQEALDEVRRRLPDLVVMDVMMPEMDGFEALRELRRFSQVPVVLLTVKADERDVIHGLELGADDYVGQTVQPGRAAVAHQGGPAPRRDAAAGAGLAELKVDERLTIDFDRHEVWKDGEKVQLRPTEFRLLYHLASNPGVVHDPRNPAQPRLGPRVPRRLALRPPVHQLPAPEARRRPRPTRTTS